MTRYGKTFCVALGLLLEILKTPIETPIKVKRIAIIAPSNDQTKILRGYINEIISNNVYLSNMLDKSKGASPSNRLRSEQSKQCLTFKNGWEIRTLTAHSGVNEENSAPSLMGWGADIVVLDEACLIQQSVYTSRISRMLGDNPANSKLIIIMNPWYKDNFAYNAWNSSDFKKVHVNWQQALEEGRTTQAYIEEQKKILTSYEWSVLYESEFSKETRDTLIKYEWIQRAIHRGKENNLSLSSNTHLVYGLDVAEQGVDKTVLTCAHTDGICYKIVNQTVITADETMPCANEVAAQISKSDRIQIDSIGIGAGVHSRLKELHYNAISVRVTEAPTQEKERYLNQKSQRYWHLRTLFEQDQISIPNNTTLITQLSQIHYKITTNGKIQIENHNTKSPDHTDSLMLTLQQQQQTELPFMFAR